MKFFIFLILLPLSLQASADPRPVFYLGYPEGNVHAPPATEALRAAYSKLGIRVEGVPIVGRRSLMLANSGQLDGELIRVPIVAEQYENLIRIPTALYTFETYAFAASPIPTIKAWHDLQGKTVGHLIGIVLYEERTKHFNRKLSHSHLELVKLLERQAIDVVIMEKYNFSLIAGDKFHRSLNPLEIGKVYHYLHKSHADLAPKVNAEIATLVQAGEVQRILEEHLEP